MQTINTCGLHDQLIFASVQTNKRQLLADFRQRINFRKTTEADKQSYQDTINENTQLKRLRTIKKTITDNSNTMYSSLLMS